MTPLNQSINLEQNQSESVESSGKTIKDAINRGLEQLQLGPDDVDVTVVSPGSRGILGLGAEDALVRLTPKQPVAPVPTEETSPPAADVADAPAVEPAADANLEQSPDVQQRAREVLESLLERMNVPAGVSTRMGHDLVEPGERVPLTLDVSGHDLGLLIGRRGETLYALQFVVRQILSKEMGRWLPVLVDVESYLVRRRKTLQQLADRMADRVVFSGRKVNLEPMAAHERRIIHLQLRDHENVYTNSVGEGDRRKVVILPK